MNIKIFNIKALHEAIGEGLKISIRQLQKIMSRPPISPELEEMADRAADLPSFRILRKIEGIAEKKIYAAFTREEAAALLQMHNSALVSENEMLSRDLFLLGLSDYNQLGEGFSFFNASYKEVLQKIEQLGIAELYFLQKMCIAFWGKENADLEAFLEGFEGR